MRIYFISGSLLPSTLASGVNVVKMCAALARLGHEVTLFGRRTGSGDPHEVFDHYGVASDFAVRLVGGKGLPLSKNLLYPLAVGWHLLRLPPPDLIYGRHAFAMKAAALVRPQVPIAYEAHAIPSRPSRRAAEEWLFRRPSFLTNFVISDALAADYREWMTDLPELDVQIARDGADPPAVPAPPQRDLGGRPGAQQVGYVGHLYAGKGMELVAELAGRMPEVDFHVVGGTAADLQQWQQRTRAASNLHYHGFVPQAQVQSYLAAVEVVLAPPQVVTRSAAGRDISRWMSPLKIFDYMAAQRPIVASDISAVREILDDGRTALLVEASAVDAWAAAIRALREPQLAGRLAAAAYADLLGKFTWTKRAEAVMQHLERRSKLHRLSKSTVGGRSGEAGSLGLDG